MVASPSLPTYAVWFLLSMLHYLFDSYIFYLKTTADHTIVEDYKQRDPSIFWQIAGTLHTFYSNNEEATV